MQHKLPADISERIQACVASGSYRSEEEVLRDALDALQQREREKLLRWHEKNAVAIEESRQGLSKPLDDEAIIARLRARLAAEGISG